MVLSNVNQISHVRRHLIADRASDFVITMGLFFPTWWILLFTFNPQIVKVMYSESDLFPHPSSPPDPVKCFMFSILFSMASVIVLWILKGFLIR